MQKKILRTLFDDESESKVVFYTHGAPGNLIDQNKVKIDDNVYRFIWWQLRGKKYGGAAA